MEGQKVQPRLLDLTLEVIQRCPNSCLFCSSLAGLNSPHRLSFGEIVDVAEQAVSLGLHTIGISGGEPLLHTEITEIIATLNKDLVVRLYTTGITTESDGKPTSFVDWVEFDPSKTTIIFNVQSSTPHVHDFLTRRPGSFQLTRRALLSAKRAGFRVEIHLVPNRLNLSTIESSVADFSKWGVDQVSFLRLVPQGNAAVHADMLLLDSQEQKKLRMIFGSLEKREQYGTKLRFGIPFTGLMKEQALCNAASSKLIVRYDGVVLPCEAFKCAPDGMFHLGTIRDNSILELLARGQNKFVMNSLKSELRNPNETETCPAQVFWAHSKDSAFCSAYQVV